MADKGSKNKKKLYDLLKDLEKQVYESDELTHSMSLENLSCHQDVWQYLSEKGRSHQHYRYYSSAGRILRVLSDSSVFLTDGLKWNDQFDSGKFNPPYSGYKRFGTCMSYSKSESIAMWMLYGGKDGDGAMIDFSRETLLDALRASQFEFGHFDKNGSFVADKSLDANKVKIDLFDVVYFKKADGQGEQFCLSLPFEPQATVSKLIFDNFGPFTKHESWSYEQEVRLIATVDKISLGNRASVFHCMKLPLRLSNDYTTSRTFNSPTSSLSDFCDSELVGTVDWDLCNGCKYKRQ